MRMSLVAPLALSFSFSFSFAQDWTPPENKNAALAYWRAFSIMKDLPSDDATLEKIRQVIAGEAEFDASLNGVVDENADAVRAMQRGSHLPECTFGLDYQDGAAMLLPHLAKARALGKLNVLSARRLVAQGKRSDAVEALLCGVRFSDHVWRDGTLICGLVAKAVWSMHVRALVQLVGEGKLDAGTLARIDEAMGKLPPYAFDWGAIILSEKACFATEWDRIIASADPKAILEEGGMFQEDWGSIENLASGKAPKEVAEKFRKEWGMEPTDLADPEKVRDYVKRSREEYATFIRDVGATLRQGYLAAAPRLAEIEGKADTFGFLTRLMIPALTKTSEHRAVVEAERAGLIALVAIARHRAEKGSDPESLDGLDVPADPFTGKPFDLAKVDGGLEVRSGGKDADGKPIAFRMAR